MTVEELIKRLRQYDPKSQALIRLEHHRPDETEPVARVMVYYPIDYITFFITRPAVLLVADQAGEPAP